MGRQAQVQQACIAGGAGTLGQGGLILFPGFRHQGFRLAAAMEAALPGGFAGAFMHGAGPSLGSLPFIMVLEDLDHSAELQGGRHIKEGKEENKRPVRPALIEELENGYQGHCLFHRSNKYALLRPGPHPGFPGLGYLSFNRVKRMADLFQKPVPRFHLAIATSPASPSGFPAWNRVRSAVAHAHFQEDINVTGPDLSAPPILPSPGAPPRPSVAYRAPDLAVRVPLPPAALPPFLRPNPVSGIPVFRIPEFQSPTIHPQHPGWGPRLKPTSLRCRGASGPTFEEPPGLRARLF